MQRILSSRLFPKAACNWDAVSAFSGRRKSRASFWRRASSGLSSTPSTAASTLKPYRTFVASPSRRLLPGGSRGGPAISASLASARLRGGRHHFPARGIAGDAGEGCELDQVPAGWHSRLWSVPCQHQYEALQIGEVIEHVNANTLVCFQIETKRALDARTNCSRFQVSMR